jgi:proline dehydrogenase
VTARRALFGLAMSSGWERAVRAVHGRERAAYRLASGYVAGTQSEEALARAQPDGRPGVCRSGGADPAGQRRHDEGPEVARPRGEPTDMAFLELAHELHANGAEVALATHDAVLREALLRSLPGIGVEMLLGVRSADATDVAARGVPVRIYTPYGHGWFRYAMRRWAESRIRANG